VFAALSESPTCSRFAELDERLGLHRPVELRASALACVASATASQRLPASLSASAAEHVAQLVDAHR
jgi:hypothetical protein